jgi:hypothetical protein
MTSNLDLSVTHSKPKPCPRKEASDPRPLPKLKWKTSNKTQKQNDLKSGPMCYSFKAEPCLRKEASASPSLKWKASNKTKNQNDLKSGPKCYTFKAEPCPRNISSALLNLIPGPTSLHVHSSEARPEWVEIRGHTRMATAARLLMATAPRLHQNGYRLLMLGDSQHGLSFERRPEWLRVRCDHSNG